MHAKSSIELPHSVRDPIHGTIRLSSEELSVVDHPLFRRLHHIRQNGLLYYVFPAATHTRFEHSLGVMHLVDAMLNNLLINSSVALNKPTPGVKSIEESDGGCAVDLQSFSSDELHYLARIGRLAGLVHDLGHGPFSHTFDVFAPSLATIRELLTEDQRLASVSAIKDFLDDPDQPYSLLPKEDPDRVKHEIMSCVLFAVLWGELLVRGRVNDASIPAAVAAVILGNPVLSPHEEFRHLVPLLHDLVASAPADADRMDYLERDSKSIGVTYGLYDRQRLLKSFLAYRVQTHSGTTHFRLGIKESGLRAVENFIQARFELYVQVYYHKTNEAVNLMLRAIAERARGMAGPIFLDADLDRIVGIYLDLSDERFLRVLRGIDPDIVVKNEDINKLGQAIHDRKLWKRVFEGRRRHEAEAVMNQIQQRETVNGLRVDYVDPKATKDLSSSPGVDHSGAALLRRGGDGVYRLVSHQSWLDLSPVMRALQDEERGISRIYLCEDDPERAKKIRVLCRQL